MHEGSNMLDLILTRDDDVNSILVSGLTFRRSASQTTTWSPVG